ncbi:MAG: 4-alpha-glucanotransferase [Eubacterium sp.]|nr:4-alpha-glucanotransferase [Candidatus Colimonas fimequi]
MNIYHNSRIIKYRNPFGAAEVSSVVNLKLDVKFDRREEYGSVQSVQVRTWHDDFGETLVDMEPVSMKKDGTVTYGADITMPEDGCLFWYFFKVTVEDANGEYVAFYGNNEKQLGGEGQIYYHEPPSYQITVFKYQPVPDWYKDGIVYQIFPDRFARDENWRERCETVLAGETDRVGQARVIEDDWYKPAYYERDAENKVVTWPFYGGSFKGIEEKLDYLTSMGVSSIYLNPIFKAVSNHRYDTADYMQVDPMLGTEEDFKSLAKAAEDKGIKLILDGVFSHTGADSIYFDKHGNFGGVGAYNNPDSEYRDWFEFIENDPVGYRAWWGVEDLPEVNEDELSFRNLICGPEGVIAKWLRAGAKGFRLDVADELPDSFIADIRHRVKAEGEDNLLLGEVWEDASNKISYNERRKYFMGDELDSTMNYPVRDLLLDFAQFKNSASDASDRIMSLMENYPKENFYGALNLIGSHDRKRIITVMGADENYDAAADRVRFLSVLQYCLPGIPCVYYGDEAAMLGDADPANRSGFIWGRENINMQLHYRQLGVIYDEHPVLKSGSLKMLPVGSEDVLAFIREDKEEKILVLVNRANESVDIDPIALREINGAYALELLTSEEIKMESGAFVNPLHVGARAAKIICILDKKPVPFDMKRGAGVICHISSIPGGMLGAPARNFVDFLESAGMSLWQVLPLNPPGLGNSPYSSISAFAANPAFINYDELPDMSQYTKFIEDNGFWLENYVAYLDNQDPLTESEKNKIRTEQYYFDVQWSELKKYAKDKGIEIIGDLPAFVSANSADVWANPELFQMDNDGTRHCHAGVPPDYFSPEGQDWGNPLYDWDALKENGYDWWIKRLNQCRQRYDYVRLDHFRSFSEYYAIPEGGYPIEGRWQHGPGVDFFRTVASKLGGRNGIRIMAEDLGQLDTGVWNLLKLTGFPGMNVWQFSEDEMRAMSPQQAKTRIFYAGTHDNQTLMGWCRENGKTTSDALAIIREMYESDAPWVMLQLQDMFMMGDEARMNVPGVAEGNWTWKVPGNSIEEGLDHAKEVAAAFKILAIETGRNVNPEIKSFLKKHAIYCNNMDKDALLDDMVSYYKDKITSGQIAGVPYNPGQGPRKVIAVDMGGTNIRVARVAISDDELTWERMVRAGIPGKTEEITVYGLFDTVAQMIATVDRDAECSSIGFSFSFQAEPAGSDMKIIEFSKELKITGGEGKSITKLLNNALVRAGQPERNIAVVNDSVATLMSGTIADNDDVPIVAGFVLGTGANVCVLDQQSKMIYNLESGHFPGLPAGDVDDEIDKKSAKPGTALAEKKMCGAYIQTIISSMTEKAVIEGLVSEDMSGPMDKDVLAHIEAGCIDRAALYAALTVATAVVLSEAHGDRCIVQADGSVFWKMAGIKENTEKYLSELLKAKGIEVVFAKVEDSSLTGAAAVATN